MSTSQPNNEDANWIRKVINIELLIEEFGICNAMAAFLQAVENIEKEVAAENEDFEGSQHEKNIEYQKQVIEFAMDAVDLHTRYGNAEARKVSKERFKDNMKSIGVMV